MTPYLYRKPSSMITNKKRGRNQQNVYKQPEKLTKMTGVCLYSSTAISNEVICWLKGYKQNKITTTRKPIIAAYKKLVFKWVCGT
jgi:hypothetical protein